ncbi:hypothetical protein Franean1_1978 [Parafrankia sp. EAN1pec]|nr:hypothetical protein Franean1_1978 [Frankia sp. EAN1pec]
MPFHELLFRRPRRAGDPAGRQSRLADGLPLSDGSLPPDRSPPPDGLPQNLTKGTAAITLPQQVWVRQGVGPSGPRANTAAVPRSRSDRRGWTTAGEQTSERPADNRRRLGEWPPDTP